MKMTFRNDDPLPRTCGNTRNVKRAFLVAWGQYFDGGTNDIIRMMIDKLILRLNEGRRRIHKFESGGESDSLTLSSTTRLAYCPLELQLHCVAMTQSCARVPVGWATI